MSPMPLAVLGHVSRRRAGARRRGSAASRSCDFQRSPTGLHRSHAGQRLQQLRLAVAGDAGHADDLAAAHREAHALHALHAEAVLHHEIRDLEQGLAGSAGVLSTRRVTARPTISSASCSGVVVGGRPRRDDAPLTHDGDDVGGLADLAQLVGDEQHGLALGAQRSQDLEEVIGLLRREDGGRLVEDQEVGAAVERLEDLHALALAHAEVRDARIGIDLQVILAAQPLELGAGPRHPRAEPEAALDPEHHVLQHRERLHQHEVLMHHADPRRQRVLGRPDRHRSPAHEDLSAIGPVIAVQDAHQRRLAGAVLADDAREWFPRARRATTSRFAWTAQTICRSPRLDDRNRQAFDRSTPSAGFAGAILLLGLGEAARSTP